MVIADRLRDLRESAEERARERQRQSFESELERAQAKESDGRVRGQLREAVKPARIEARATKQEAKKLTEQNVRDVASVGGKAALRQAKRAAAAANTAPRERGRMDDDSRRMFRNAERATTAAPPVDATLDPLSGPEELGAFVRGATGPSDGPGGREASVDMLVTGPPADNGGMMELVLGGGAGVDDAPMEAFVTGRDPSDDDREPRLDDMVRGRGGDR